MDFPTTQHFRWRRPRKRELAIIIIAMAAFGIFEIIQTSQPPSGPTGPGSVSSSSTPSTPGSGSSGGGTRPPNPHPPSVFSYTFNVPGVLYEAGSGANSTSPYWWVNSGAKLIIANGVGTTVEGSLPADDYWRLLYERDNPSDTDDGYHPQNIFRLVTQYAWTDYRQQIYFKIDAVNVSASPNRNESNGLLLFNRYRDAFNLYYAGIRVDGTSVIKKKLNGNYVTLAQQTIFPGTYDPVRSPNLIPVGIWIGLRTDVVTTAGNGVLIQLYLDLGRTGHWILISQAADDGTGDGPVIQGPAHLGIRTDFMDVAMSDYLVEAR